MPYVNIKTKARTFKGTSIPAKEVSVDFKLYSDVHNQPCDSGEIPVNR
jgi:hypothetical protein